MCGVSQGCIVQSSRCHADDVEAFQELALAEESSILFKDGRTISWIFVRLCRSALIHERMIVALFGQRNTIVLRERLGFDHRTYPDSLQESQFIVKASDEPTLGQLLLFVSNRKASDNNDRIYGLLGLVDEDTRSTLMVNYSASDASVYMQALKVVAKTSYRWLVLLWEIYDLAPSVVSGLSSWLLQPGREFQERWRKPCQRAGPRFAPYIQAIRSP